MVVDDSPLLMVVQTQLPEELAGWWLSRRSDWPTVAQLPEQLAQILTNPWLIYCSGERAWSSAPWPRSASSYATTHGGWTQTTQA